MESSKIRMGSWPSQAWFLLENSSTKSNKQLAVIYTYICFWYHASHLVLLPIHLIFFGHGHPVKKPAPMKQPQQPAAIPNKKTLETMGFTDICLAETSMVWMSLVLWVICCCECSTSSWLAGARRSGGYWYKEVRRRRVWNESFLTGAFESYKRTCCCTWKHPLRNGWSTPLLTIKNLIVTRWFLP